MADQFTVGGKVTLDTGQAVAGAKQVEAATQRMASAFNEVAKAEVASAKLAGTHYATLRAQRLGLATDLESVTSRIRAADAATVGSSAAAGAAVGRTGNQLRMAQASAMIFERQMGIQMPRAINAMLARSELIGPILQGAFSIGLIVLFVQNIGSMIESLQTAASAAGGYGEAVRKGFVEAIKASDEALVHFKTIKEGISLVDETNRNLVALELHKNALDMNVNSVRAWGLAMAAVLAMPVTFGASLIPLVKNLKDLYDTNASIEKQQGRLRGQLDTLKDLQEKKNKEDERAAKALHAHAAAAERAAAAHWKLAEAVGGAKLSALVNDIEKGIKAEEDFKLVLRRIFLLLIETADSLLEGVKANNRLAIEAVEEKHDNINKFVNYCLRLLNKYGYPDVKKTCFYYHIIASIDKIADIIKYNARDMQAYKPLLRPETVRLWTSVNRSIRLYYELFYDFSLEKVNALSSNRDAVKTGLTQCLKKIPAEEVLFLTNMKQILEILLDLTEYRMGLEY